MKKLLVVDGNSIVNRAFYGIRPLSTQDGFPTNALYGMMSMIGRQIDDLSPDFAAIAFDLKAPTFRHKMYDAYKAGRRPMPEDLVRQMPLTRTLAAAMGLCVIEKEGYEADDILGTLTKTASDNGIAAYVMTGDRDSLQLIGPDVTVLLATTGETVPYDGARFLEKYGVRPDQYVDVKALMGDSSDNIPGVPGIGEKTAFKLIADYGDLEGVFASLEGEPKHTPSVIRKLTEGRESAYLSKTLATICREVPLDLTLDDLSYSGVKKDDLAELCRRFEFSGMIKKYGLDELTGTAPATEETVTVPVTREVTAYELIALPDTALSFSVCDGKLYVYDGERILACALDSEGLSEFFCGHGHLSVFDCKVAYQTLRRYGIFWQGAEFDPMLGAYIVNSGEGSYDPDRIVMAFLHRSLSSDVPMAYYTCLLREPILNELEKSGQTAILTDLEMPLSTVLDDMETDGFRIDTEGIAAYGKQLDNQAHELEERIFYLAGGDFNINSPKQLGEVLFERLGLPSGKKTKTGYSTNAEILEKLKPYHPIVSDILEYRQVTKLKSTYTDGLIRVADENGYVHTTFKQTGTATGRLSSAEPNLQNIPIRTDMGRELRRYFVPKNKDYVLIDADYSQIELRLLAHISGDGTMTGAFVNGEDIHTSTAATVFGIEPEEVTKDMRKRAKAVNFGILYGQGEFSLADDLGISRRQAREYIDSYLASYPLIDLYLNEVIESARRDGYATTMFGRRRYIPELKVSNKNVQHFGERVAMNSPIQGSAADIIKLAMIRVHRRLHESGLDAKLILQVHDELLIEAHRDCADEALTLLCEEMENAVKLNVPLEVDVHCGDNWYEAH